MYKDNTGDDYNNHLPNGNTEVILFAANYGHLLGILGGGFYLHNISLPIYRNSKNPENSVRDMFLGFFCRGHELYYMWISWSSRIWKCKTISRILNQR